MPAVALAPDKSATLKERLAQLRAAARSKVRKSQGTPEQLREQSIQDLKQWTALRDKANKRLA